jgi:hypothetical protein
MNSKPEKAKGWKGQSFTFGTQDQHADERELSDIVHSGMEVLADGCYRTMPDIDALDAN